MNDIGGLAFLAAANCFSMRSRKEMVIHRAAHIGQPEVAARVAVGQTLVIDPHQVQDGRVQIVDVHAAILGGEAEFV